MRQLSGEMHTGEVFQGLHLTPQALYSENLPQAKSSGSNSNFATKVTTYVSSIGYL